MEQLYVCGLPMLLAAQLTERAFAVNADKGPRLPNASLEEMCVICQTK